MAFVLPTFNLSVNHWTAGSWQANGPYTIGQNPPFPDHTFPAQLRVANRSPDTFGFVDVQCQLELVMPKGSPPITPAYSTSEWQYWCDVVEVPAGTGRFYLVLFVDDVAKGFGNEYRFAIIAPTNGLEGAVFNSSANWPYAPAWPQPYP